jgi:hypothetical protein
MTKLKTSSDMMVINHGDGDFWGSSLSQDLVQVTKDSTVFISVNKASSKYTNLYYTNYGNNWRADFKSDAGINLQSAWTSSYSTAFDNSQTKPLSSVYDFVIDWSSARFTSIELQYNFGTSQDPNWIALVSYSNPKGPTAALPNFAVDVNIASSVTYLNTLTGFEKEAALYNWQFPSSGPISMALFGDDYLEGTKKSDLISGFSGNDDIRGDVGDDVIFGSYGADTMYGDSGNDVIVFDGGCSVWDYLATTKVSWMNGTTPTTTTFNNGNYVSSWISSKSMFATTNGYKPTIDIASGGSGNDDFVFQLPVFTLTSENSNYRQYANTFFAKAYLDTLKVEPSAVNFERNDIDAQYNPYQSQNMISTPFWYTESPTKVVTSLANSYNLSPLTFWSRINDFKVGQDQLDLSFFGLTEDFFASNSSIGAKKGSAFIGAVNTLIAADGYKLAVGKSVFTSGNTVLMVQELTDQNANGTGNDTLVAIELVGISQTAIGKMMFGEAVY